MNKFSTLRDKMSKSAQQAIQKKKESLLESMALKELRQARKLSQEKLAETLQVKQSSVSKIEHRTDIYLSTLRSYVEAMGGELDIVAKFPEGDVHINQFAQISDGR